MKRELKFLIFIFTLYFLFVCFSVIFVKIQCELSEIRGTERLFIDMHVAMTGRQLRIEITILR